VLVDTAVVGHLGTPQLGGLAVAGTLLTTGFWVFNFLAYGTTALVARLIGAGDRRTAAEQAVQATWLALVLGTALALAGLLVAPAAVSLMGAGARVRPHALLYLRISLGGSPAVLIALAGMGYLRGLQDTRATLAVAVAANVANLALEVVLIYGVGLGIGASAAATVLAQWGAAAAYLIIIRRNVLAAGAVRLRPAIAGMRATAVIGRDLLVRTGSLLGALAVATAVASRLGTASLGAHQIAYQIWTFLALSLDAVAIAAQAMIGRLLGAGDVDRARDAGRRMIEWGIVLGVACALVVAALRGPLVGVFTSDHAVRAHALTVLWIVAAFQPVNAVVFVLDGVLIGAGEFRYLAALMVVSAVVFVPSALAVLVTDAGLLALWGTLGLWMGVRLAGNALRFAGGRWQVPGASRAR
jgi:putative MATE family efflux protein